MVATEQLPGHAHVVACCHQCVGDVASLEMWKAHAKKVGDDGLLHVDGDECRRPQILEILARFERVDLAALCRDGLQRREISREIMILGLVGGREELG